MLAYRCQYGEGINLQNVHILTLGAEYETGGSILVGHSLLQGCYARDYVHLAQRLIFVIIRERCFAIVGQAQEHVGPVSNNNGDSIRTERHAPVDDQSTILGCRGSNMQWFHQSNLVVRVLRTCLEVKWRLPISKRKLLSNSSRVFKLILLSLKRVQASDST